MTCNTTREEAIALLTQKFEKDLISKYGSLVIGGNQLKTVLGYSTAAAFRQAVSKNTVPVHLFTVKNRRGKFAFVMDIAKWMADLRGQKPMDVYGAKRGGI